MAYFSRKSKVDGNHAVIVEAFEKAGCSVQSVAPIKDFVDVVVGYKGFNFIFEIKNPERPKSATKLKDKQKELQETWRGQIAVIYTFDEGWAIIKDTLTHYAIF